VLPGATATIPVAVQASGDRVVNGSVAAAVPDGWTTTPVAFSIDTRNGPARQTVDVTVHAPDTGPGGPVDVPITATAGRTEASTTATLLRFGAWPNETTATASSYHAPNEYNGQPRTYAPGNAIDADLSTFWNDDTPGAFPDTLTVSAPQAVTLHGIGFASIVDGVPTDFSVQTWDGANWVTQAQVTGNSELYRWIAFPNSVTTTQVRLVITASQTQNGNFSRVVEVAP
jgi:hypothetical protein